jgi:transposase
MPYGGSCSPAWDRTRQPAPRAYVERRTKEGKSKAEIIRCFKRYVARHVYPHLRPAAD